MIKLEIGDKYGKLSFVSVVKHDSPRKVLMLCDCGNESEVWLSNLTSGHTKSCGCSAKEEGRNATHGKSKTKEYKSWQCMLYQVYNPKSKYFDKYSKLEGAVQENWIHSFTNFLDHIGS